MFHFFDSKNNNLLLLNKLSGAMLAFGEDKLINTSSLALRARDTTSTELDFGFSAKSFDSGSLSTWLTRDLISSIPLGVDTNPVNGVSDGWEKTNSNTTSTCSIDGIYQKIEVLSSTGTTPSAGVRKIYQTGNFIPVAIGDIVTFSATIKTTGNVKARLSLNVYANDPPTYTYKTTRSTSSDYTSEADLFITMTTTINSSGAGAILPILFAIPNTSGDVGSVWFKNASITISNQMAYASAVYDQTGSSRNATQTTASTQPRIVNLGTVDSGIVFDGIDDNISVSDDASLRLNGDHTIMFLSYFNTLGGASAYNNFITKGSVSAGGNGFVMYTGNNSTTFKYARDAQSVTSGNITTGQWQLWAIVCNGTNQQWYLNGVPSGNATNLTFATNTNNGVMYIGANSSSSPCDVTLRLFSVFNRALAQSELVYAYNYLKKVYNL